MDGPEYGQQPLNADDIAMAVVEKIRTALPRKYSEDVIYPVTISDHKVYFATEYIHWRTLTNILAQIVNVDASKYICQENVPHAPSAKIVNTYDLSMCHKDFVLIPVNS